MMPAAVDVPDDWVGKKWTGRDGALLLLSRNKYAYAILIKSATGEAIYEGVVADREIRFEREGTMESLRSTTGRETGIEAFFGKDHCLTIKEGEGFCRADLSG